MNNRPYSGAYSRRRFSNAAVVNGISTDYQQDPGNGGGSDGGENPFNVENGGNVNVNTKFRTLSVKWDGSMGSVTGSGNFNANDGFGLATAAEGDTITLTARANTGCHFVKWKGGITTSASNPISIKMSVNREVIAVFAKDPDDPETLPPGDNPEGSPLSNSDNGGDGITFKDDLLGFFGVGDRCRLGKPTIMTYVRKYWWAILIVGYIIYKERAKK